MQDPVTHPYGLQDVERLIRLPRKTIRAFVSAGFVAPARGARNALRFSFRDLIVLRAAQALADAQVPQRRITRALKALRRQLPESMPLSGLSVCAVGERVVVNEGPGRWQAESGQYLLAFEGDPASGSSSAVAPAPNHGVRPPDARPGPAEALALFEQGCLLESGDPEEAVRAYEKALAADPALVDARINLGRLLHELGRHARAERAYRAALEGRGEDPLLFYNLGVLLDDMGRLAEACEAYESALRADPEMADAHYNLGLLCQRLRRPREAIRHMARYRALVRE